MASALLPAAVTPPGTATSTITTTALNGLNLSNVALTCAITPAATPSATCSVGTMSVSGTTGISMLTVTTVGPTSALAPGDRRPGALFALGLIIPAMLLGGAGLGTQNRKKLLSFCIVFLVLSGCVFQVACGGGGKTTTTTPTGNSGTPAGTYTVTVTGTAGSTQHTTLPVTLTVQ